MADRFMRGQFQQNLFDLAPTNSRIRCHRAATRLRWFLRSVKLRNIKNIEDCFFPTSRLLVQPVSPRIARLPLDD